ncbi:hypothetical protein QBC32DRAFT_337953 [Pseudoneurospora amorphoporcata]|uniref:C2H2-type domain-containing protein n=1 Tax=Pseudoneurospora amorphoporcata TaxID=241081 RepID=A0AAN6NXP9_9PEZI|nr:hypothetical protein QBC32DRAFT_337953 [Pseudoneurospora amorphoporcata]
MSGHVYSPYSLNPDGFASSPFQTDEQHTTGTASVPPASWVTTSSASSGNPSRSIISQVQGQSSRSDAYLHDFGYPIDSSAIDLARSQSASFARDLENAFDDTGRIHSLRALEAHHPQRVRGYIVYFESRISNTSPALPTGRPPATAGAGYGDAHHGSASNPANLASFVSYGNPPKADRSAATGLSDNYPWPPIDSSKFITTEHEWNTCLGVGNSNFANGSRPSEGQMGMVDDVRMSGMPTATPSGPSQMTSSLKTGSSSFGQSANSSRGTAVSGPSSANLSAPSRSPAQHRSPTPSTVSGSTTGLSASDRPPPVPCPIFDCAHTAKTKRDVQRHVDGRHRDRAVELALAGWTLTKDIPCPYCGHKTPRMDNMKRHIDTMHKKGSNDASGQPRQGRRHEGRT